MTCAPEVSATGLFFFPGVTLGPEISINSLVSGFLHTLENY